MILTLKKEYKHEIDFISDTEQVLRYVKSSGEWFVQSLYGFWDYFGLGHLRINYR